MNQIKIADIRNFLDKDDANYKQLFKDFQALLKLENALTQGLSKFVDQIDNIAKNELNQYIAQVFKAFVSTLKDVNEARKIYVDLLRDKILPSITGLIEDVKDRRINLVDYEKTKHDEEKKDQALRMNSDPSKTNVLHQSLEDAKQKCLKSGLSLSTKFKMYVYEKNTEIKEMFQHFINRQLFYQAKGIQRFSELALQIKKSEDETESQRILDAFLGTQKEAKADAKNDKLHQAHQLQSGKTEQK